MNSRRRFLKNLSYTAGLIAFPAVSQSAIKYDSHRQLAFENLHTGEKLSVVYQEHGQYIPEALAEINRLLRDHRTGDIHLMDISLMDLLHDLQKRLDVNQPFQIISGYRSPKTNAKLRKKSSGVASKSLHMQGKAIDICLEKVDLKSVRNAALAMRQGGVGYYPRSNFVHLDTGRVRSW